MSPTEKASWWDRPASWVLEHGKLLAQVAGWSAFGGVGGIGVLLGLGLGECLLVAAAAIMVAHSLARVVLRQTRGLLDEVEADDVRLVSAHIRRERLFAAAFVVIAVPELIFVHTTESFDFVAKLGVAGFWLLLISIFAGYLFAVSNVVTDLNNARITCLTQRLLYSPIGSKTVKEHIWTTLRVAADEPREAGCDRLCAVCSEPTVMRCTAHNAHAASAVRSPRGATGSAVTVALMATFALAFAATAGGVVRPRDQVRETTTATTTTSTAPAAASSTTATAQPPNTQVPADGQMQNGGAEHNETQTYADRCGVGTIRPGDGAPDWAERSLTQFVLGDNVGMGAILGGCSELAVAEKGHEGEVEYQIGRDANHVLMSVAVASQRDGSCILLRDPDDDSRTDPATRTLALLKDGKVLGCSGRYMSGSGDIQTLYTEQGTVTFVRMNLHDSIRGGSSLLITLPPQATRLWYSTMLERGEWLWPTGANGVPNPTTIALVEPKTGKIVLTLVRAEGGGGWRLNRGAVLLRKIPTIEDLRALAPAAPDPDSPKSAPGIAPGG